MLSRNRVLLCLILALLAHEACYSQGELQSLKIEDAESIGLENNYTIQSLLHQSMQGYYIHNATVGKWLPQVNASAISTRTGAIGTIPPSYGTINESTLTFFQNILNTDDYFNVKIADLNYQVLRTGALLRACDVLLNIRVGYYSIIFAQISVKVQQDNVKLLEKEWIRERARFEAGEGILYRVNQSETALENARTAVYQAERELQIATYDFLAQLALPPLTKLSLEQHDIPIERYPEIYEKVKLIIESPNSERLFSEEEILEWEKMAVFFKPEIQISRLNTWIAKVNLCKQQYEYTPTINLFADYFNNGGKVAPPKSFWNMGVNVNWTLFDGFARENRVLGARETLLAAEEDYRESVLVSQVAINDSVADFKEGLQSYRSSKRAVEVADEAVALLQNAEVVGKATFLDYLDSVQALTNARLNFYQAKFNLITAYFGLLRATGKDVWSLKLALDQTGGFTEFSEFSAQLSKCSADSQVGPR